MALLKSCQKHALVSKWKKGSCQPAYLSAAQLFVLNIYAHILIHSLYVTYRRVLWDVLLTYLYDNFRAVTMSLYSFCQCVRIKIRVMRVCMRI